MKKCGAKNPETCRYHSVSAKNIKQEMKTVTKEIKVICRTAGISTLSDETDLLKGKSSASEFFHRIVEHLNIFEASHLSKKYGELAKTLNTLETELETEYSKEESLKLRLKKLLSKPLI